MTRAGLVSELFKGKYRYWMVFATCLIPLLLMGVVSGVDSWWGYAAIIMGTSAGVSGSFWMKDRYG